MDLTDVLGATAPAAQRRVLSAVGEIDHLSVTVSMTGLPDHVTTVTATDLAGGATSVAFASLPTGTCRVTIAAFAADGTPIGSSSRVAPIAEAHDTALHVRVLIVPDDGSGYSWANSLVFGVDLAAAPALPAPDGLGPASGTVLDSFGVAGNFGIYADDAGHLYSRTFINQSQQSVVSLQRYATADGARMEAYLLSAGTSIVRPSAPVAYDPLQGVLFAGGRLSQSIVVKPGDSSLVMVNGAYLAGAMAVDAAGDALYNSQGVLMKRTSGGVTSTTIPVQSMFAIDTTGRFWVNRAAVTTPKVVLANEVCCYDAAGVLLLSAPLAFPAARIQSDREGGVWVADRPGGQIAHVAADGTVDAALGISVTDFCVDAQHRLWVAAGPQLIKLATDGSQLGIYPIQARYLAYGDGYLFASVDGTQSVLKVVP